MQEQQATPVGTSTLPSGTTYLGGAACVFVADSESRGLTLVRPDAAVPVDPAAVSVETGLADVITLQRRREARISAHDEEIFSLDTLSEYQWARDAAWRRRRRRWTACAKTGSSTRRWRPPIPSN
ncbi:hypothetical protein QF037_000237 [Streptomyces canus]|nr:hypothetical protein [Streptomyces canus]